jgi:hypothetical protein
MRVALVVEEVAASTAEASMGVVSVVADFTVVGVSVLGPDWQPDWL